MKLLRLAWRQLRRDLASGDIRILVAALSLAVGAVTAIGFVPGRAERALAIEANRLLGGDAVVRGAQPIDRESVVQGTSVSVRVDLGCRSMIQKKKHIHHNKIRY